MAVVPMLFRDIWDDFDFPLTSRLLDQHFGTALNRDDLLSTVWGGCPALTRTGYRRPWQYALDSLQRQDDGSTVNIDKDKFEVKLDVQQFAPNEVNVKVSGRYIVVEGKHEEKQDEHGYISRQFSRRYLLPENVNSEAISSQLSSDGVLTVCAPLKALPASKDEPKKIQNHS
uniref:Heat shock protein Hsp19.5 n=1 Tax=Liriomyza sativae TaxID=127406 RepID=Q1PCB4_LIRSA|nr:heat shock protein Hsp19.5 [Liriomyza sativae]